MHLNLPFLAGFMTLLAAAGILVPLLQRLRLGPVMAYLLTGVLIGPFGLPLLFPEGTLLASYWVGNGIEVKMLAELGVIFLLFVIGLEISPALLFSLRHYVLGLGGLQMIITLLTIGGVAYGFGNSLAASLLLGAALAMSSTAIVMQILSDRHASGQMVGRVSFSILLMQDLAVVPLLVMAGALTDGEALGPVMLSAATKAFLAIGVIVLIGRVLLRPLFRQAARAVGSEAFLALVLLVAVGTSALTGAAGLSVSLGAFLAGMLLAETEYSRAIETYIAPFKGLLLGVFFISVGMGLDVRQVFHQVHWLIPAFIGLIVLKSVIITGLGRVLFHLPWPVALESGLLLSQAGEFAFIAIGITMSRGLLGHEVGQFMLILTGLSMLATPAIAHLARTYLQRLERANPAGLLPPTHPGFDGHVLLAGYGRVGRVVAEVLEAEGIPWAALEIDSILVSAARKRGRPVWYGDARLAGMLERMNISKARGVIVTVDQTAMAEDIVLTVRHNWPNLPISARTRDRVHARLLRRLGGVEVVPENLEVALQLAALSMRALRLNEDMIQHRLELARNASFDD